MKADKWFEAIDECGLKISSYTRERGENEFLPWDFIDIFVTKDYLLKERKKAYSCEVTGSCFKGCKACGVQKEFKCDRC